MQNEENILDLIIIGAGPGGVTAAIYAERAGLNFKIFESLVVGGQILNTGTIENYPALPNIQGADLAFKFAEHLNELNIKVNYEKIKSITDMKEKKNIFSVKTAKETYSARNIIIATGANPRKLELENEERLSGKGVSYCATCDGAFYKDKVVAVVGGGNTAVQSAITLSRIAKKVYIIHRKNNFSCFAKTADRAYKLQEENIEILWDSSVTKLIGEKKLEKVEVKKEEGEKIQLEIDGLFVAIGRIPQTDLLDGLAKTNDYGEIIVNEKMETSIPGLYAIGDVTEKQEKQILTAMSDAIIAEKNIEYSTNN